jgi:hypothetical protein
LIFRRILFISFDREISMLIMPLFQLILACTDARGLDLTGPVALTPGHSIKIELAGTTP